jgi:hypothetical protein
MPNICWLHGNLLTFVNLLYSFIENKLTCLYTIECCD